MDRPARRTEPQNGTWLGGVCLAALLGAVAVCPAAAQSADGIAETPLRTSLIPEPEGLTGDIDNLQGQIEAAVDSEQAVRASRLKVSEFLGKADALVTAGDFDGASAMLLEAEGAALPDDQTARTRVTLAKVSLAIRNGDVSDASSLLAGLGASGDLPPATAKQVEELSKRIAAESQSIEREKAIDAVTSVTNQSAIEAAREESRRDPGNFALRLVLSDLLRRDRQFDEARSTVEALLSDPAASGNPDIRQRAVLALGRIAVDQGQFEEANRRLEELRGTAETPQRERRVADLQSRIERQQARAAADRLSAERRALVDEIAKLSPRQGVERARQAAEADPDNLPVRLLYGDLLRKAGRLAEARSVADSIVTAATGVEADDERQRAIVLLGRIEIDRGDFAAASAQVERLRAESPSLRRDQRVADLLEDIEYEQVRARERAVAEARKARERAEAEARKREEERIAAAITAAEAKPEEEGLADLKALVEANPGQARIANAYARALARAWRWAEAEAVYRGMIGDPETASNEVLAANEAAALGLADLYLRTNNIARANRLLARLETAVGQAAPPRLAELQSRIDEELTPNRMSGSLTLRAGYDSKVNTADNPEADIDDFLEDTKPSGFLTLDARARYERVVSDNGDRLRIQARFQQTPFFSVEDVDRTSGELNGGFIYNVPGTRTRVETLAGLGARFLDYDTYQRTVYGQLNVETDFTARLDSRFALSVSGNDYEENDRDNVAVEGDARMRYRLTPADSIQVSFNARYESAREDFESRFSFGPTIVVRRDFSVADLPDFYVFASYNPSFTLYGGETETGAEAGRTREDLTHRLDFGIGREISPEWRVELNGSYVYRNSNFDGKDGSDAQVSVALTRSFGQR